MKFFSQSIETVKTKYANDQQNDYGEQSVIMPKIENNFKTLKKEDQGFCLLIRINL